MPLRAIKLTYKKELRLVLISSFFSTSLLLLSRVFSHHDLGKLLFFGNCDNERVKMRGSEVASWDCL